LRGSTRKRKVKSGRQDPEGERWKEKWVNKIEKTRIT
jgi:hypothetical protein